MAGMGIFIFPLSIPCQQILKVYAVKIEAEK
jgi:hypothetical protein